MRRSTAHLYATGLFLASLIAPFLATPDVLRENALLGLLIATPLVAVASLIPGSADGRPSPGHADLWVTGIAGLALTGVYWWRASLGISAFGEGLGFEITRTFLFWLPAVPFACMYRAPGEGWLPSGRRRLLLRMTTAFFGAALGVTLQGAALDAYRERVDARHDARPLDLARTPAPRTFWVPRPGSTSTITPVPDLHADPAPP